MSVVRFPRGAKARQRLGLSRSGRQAALDCELREIDAAMAALKTRRRVVVSELKQEVRKLAKVAAMYSLATCLCTVQACPLASFKRVFMSISTTLF